MTIQELYDWAVENQITDSELCTMINGEYIWFDKVWTNVADPSESVVLESDCNYNCE